MKHIQRNSALYLAYVEYGGDYSVNHVLGCAHGCTYPCYAYFAKQRFGQVVDYADWCQPKLISNALELIEENIPKLKASKPPVFFSSFTDPFMFGFDEVAQMSLKIIRKLNDAGIKCMVLTKGILPIELADLSPDNEYGISLVTLDENFRKKYEPNSATYAQRISALRDLHNRGFKTWIDMEPYPTPNIINQNIYDVLEPVRFVDKIIFGRWYHSQVPYDFPNSRDFYNRHVNIIKNLGVDFYIKKGTER